MSAVTEMFIYTSRKEIVDTLVIPNRLIAYFKLYDNQLTAMPYGYLWSKSAHLQVEMRLMDTKPNSDEVLHFNWNLSGASTDVLICVTEISSTLSKILIIEKEWDSTPSGMDNYNKQMRIWSHFVVRLKLYLEHGLKVYKDHMDSRSDSVC